MTGPIDVFDSAQRLHPEVRYRVHLTANVAVNGSVRSSAGVTFGAAPISRQRGPIDTLIVVGGEGVIDAAADEELMRHIRRLARGARRVATVCTGTFLLAEAGLLDHKRATTHWKYTRLLARMYPLVSVETDPIYVRDGNTWTSAGVTSGIDLTLALLADDYDEHVAANVARHLVVYLRRSGGQAQFSVPLAAQTVAVEPIRALIDWLPGNLSSDLTVDALAERVHLSPRHFVRVFTREVASPPAHYIESLRLEAACRLLETTELAIEQIARECGFGTPETMHRAFRRRRSTTPMQHRQHFSTTNPSR